MKKPSSSPAQRGRSAIADAVRKRGQSPYNLWIIRPPLDGEDIVVNSDPKMELVYLLEGDPQLDEIDYGPLRQAPVGDTKGPRRRPPAGPEHFANVVRAGVPGRVLWGGTRPPQTALLAPADLYLTFVDLDGQVMRIDNWRRIAAAIRRVRAFPTTALERQVMASLGQRAAMSVADVLEAAAAQPPAMVLGVIGLLLRRRLADSDADRRPWSMHTRIWARRPS